MIYVHKHQIQWCWFLLYDSGLLFWAGFGQYRIELSDMAQGLFFRASRVEPRIWCTMVDCWVRIALQPTDDSQTSFYSYCCEVLTTLIAVYCCVNCWGTIQCHVKPNWYTFSTGWIHKKQPCHKFTSINTKTNAADPFNMMVDCCVRLGLIMLARFCEILAMASTIVRPRVYPKSDVLWLIVVSIWAWTHRGLN